MIKYKEEYLNKIIEIESFLNDLGTISLLGGNSGLVIFYLNLFKLTENEAFYLKAEALLQNIINTLNIKNHSFDLGAGYSGVFWMLKYASNNNFINLETDFFDSNMERHLKLYSSDNLKDKKFDFLYGGLSPCLFFLEKNNINDNNYYKDLIHLLETNSIEDSNGIYWKNTIFTKREDFDKEINLGLAHGIPSIIYFLVKIYSLGIEKEKSITLIEKSINWLLAIKNMDKNSNLSVFPSSIMKGESIKYNSRLGWCYGDLGIASVIWQAGKVTNNKKWKEEAIEIMIRSTKRRNLEDNFVIDAGICHGTAGIAQIFNRFYWETNLPEFKETANYWINETLKMAYHKDGLAGYKIWTGREDGWINGSGLLEGIIGVGLALISHISNEEPIWDRCLLLN